MKVSMVENQDFSGNIPDKMKNILNKNSHKQSNSLEKNQ